MHYAAVSTWIGNVYVYYFSLFLSVEEAQLRRSPLAGNTQSCSYKNCTRVESVGVLEAWSRRSVAAAAATACHNDTRPTLLDSSRGLVRAFRSPGLHSFLVASSLPHVDRAIHLATWPVFVINGEAAAAGNIRRPASGPPRSTISNYDEDPTNGLARWLWAPGRTQLIRLSSSSI